MGALAVVRQMDDWFCTVRSHDVWM